MFVTFYFFYFSLFNHTKKMDNKKIILVSRFPQVPEALKILYDNFEVRVNEGEPYSKIKFKKAIRDIEGLICSGKDIIDDELMKYAPKLKIISIPGAGYNNIDIEAAKRRGIAVTNTPDVLTETVADFTFGLILAVSRRITEANDILKSRKPLKWSGFYLPANDVYHKTLGLVGFGRIGKAVAQRAVGFKMKII